MYKRAVKIYTCEPSQILISVMQPSKRLRPLRMALVCVETHHIRLNTRMFSPEKELIADTNLLLSSSCHTSSYRISSSVHRSSSSAERSHQCAAQTDYDHEELTIENPAKRSFTNTEIFSGCSKSPMVTELTASRDCKTKINDP